LVEKDGDTSSRAGGNYAVGAVLRVGLVTLPERKQPVQTFMRTGVAPTRARTRWMFGFQRRLVRRWECETFMPNDGFLPQISQTDAIRTFSYFNRRCRVQTPYKTE